MTFGFFKSEEEKQARKQAKEVRKKVSHFPAMSTRQKGVMDCGEFTVRVAVHILASATFIHLVRTAPRDN